MGWGSLEVLSKTSYFTFQPKTLPDGRQLKIQYTQKLVSVGDNPNFALLCNTKARDYTKTNESYKKITNKIRKENMKGR